MNANQKTAAMKIIAEGLSEDGTDKAVPGPEEEAAARLAGLVSPEAVDRMLADADRAGCRWTGRAGCWGS